MRPVGGVEDADGVHDARPSVLYAPTGPWGPSVASFDLKQPSMHRRSTIRRLGRASVSVPSEFCLSRASPSVTADDITIGSSGNLALERPRHCLPLGRSSAQFPELPFSATAVDAFNGFGGQRSITSYPTTYIEKRTGQLLLRPLR